MKYQIQTQFENFRDAALFFAPKEYTAEQYDAACEFVRKEIKAGRVKIAPFKTDWKSLGEALSFVVMSFLALSLCSAMMAWVQIETVCPQWFFVAFAAATMTTWVFYSIKAFVLFLGGKCRRIYQF